MEPAHKAESSGVRAGAIIVAVLSILVIGGTSWALNASADAKTAAASPKPEAAAPKAEAAGPKTAEAKPAVVAPASEAAAPPAATTKVAAEDAAAPAAGDAAAAPAGGATCCEAGDQTPPLEVVAKYPPGTLHSPYQDYKKLAAEDKDLVKQFRLPGCNECHGGTGGGGFCPALTQGVWFWGNTDDVLFRLISIGSAALPAQGFERLQWGSVHGPMPPMGHTIKTADHLWKIIAFIRSINPPNSNPPEKLVAPHWTAPANAAPAEEKK